VSTPRTEAAIVRVPYADLPGSEIRIAEFVPADLARAIESELADCKKTNAELAIAVDFAVDRQAIAKAEDYS